MRGYLIGFIGSLILTLVAYFLVVEKAFDPWTLLYILSFLASLQALVQLVFFLHLGQEAKPYWNLLVFFFMAIILICVVFGSLWIMANLDYNMGMG